GGPGGGEWREEGPPRVGPGELTRLALAEPELGHVRRKQRRDRGVEDHVDEDDETDQADDAARRALTGGCEGGGAGHGVMVSADTDTFRSAQLVAGRSRQIRVA